MFRAPKKNTFVCSVSLYIGTKSAMNTYYQPLGRCRCFKIQPTSLGKHMAYFQSWQPAWRIQYTDVCIYILPWNTTKCLITKRQCGKQVKPVFKDTGCWLVVSTEQYHVYHLFIWHSHGNSLFYGGVQGKIIYTWAMFNCDVKKTREKLVGTLIPNIWQTKRVPNHQLGLNILLMVINRCMKSFMYDTPIGWWLISWMHGNLPYVHRGAPLDDS